jgi:hypothetical protein
MIASLKSKEPAAEKWNIVDGLLRKGFLNRIAEISK